MRKTDAKPIVPDAPPAPPAAVEHEVQVRGRRRPPMEGLQELQAKLMAEGPVKAGPLTLTPTMIKTHPAHPNQVVEEGESGIPMVAYVIAMRGKDLGHIIVHSDRKYCLIAPRIQQLPSTHLNLSAASLRAEIAAKGYAERRKAERKSA